MGWERLSEGVRTLPVALTDAQMAEVGHDLGELHAKIAEAEAERAAVMKDLKAGIDARKAEATRLASTLASRTRNDDVPVRSEFNFDENAIRITRIDTHEIVETRAMTTEERTKLAQQPIPVPIAEDAAMAGLLAGEPAKRAASIRRRKGKPDVRLDADGLPPEPGTGDEPPADTDTDTDTTEEDPDAGLVEDFERAGEVH